MSKIDQQLEELLSRQPDGDLSVVEQTQVRQAAREDSTASALASAYDRLHHILAGWRCLPENLDWKSFSTAVGSLIEEQPADQPLNNKEGSGPSRKGVAPAHEKTDDLLRDWAGPLPSVDWKAFQNRVSGAVRREAAASPRPPQGTARSWRVAEWMVPLAAAAAIALIVWRPSAIAPHDPGPSGRDAPRVLVSLQVPESEGTIAVAFDESPPQAASESRPIESGSAIAIGPARDEAAFGFDEAYLY